jgi:hypothetical protein
VDEEILTLLDKSAVTFQAVLTKADKIGARDRAKVLDQVRGALRKHPAAYPGARRHLLRDGRGDRHAPRHHRRHREGQHGRTPGP